MRLPNRIKNIPAAAVRWIALAAVAAVVGTVMLACRTTNRAVVVLPDYPGAKYIGSKECEQCHDTIYRDFQTADHARLITGGANALNAGCESCHGPGSVHSDSGGEIKPPFSFSSGRPQPTSALGRQGVDPARATEDVCYQCHQDVRGEFNLPHHHPVPEGKMSCTQCHPPHKGIAHVGGSTRLTSKEENCIQCHPSQRGPHVFEHEAMREGCSACHSAHGSVNPKMLTERDSNLCLKCHFQEVRGDSLLIGGIEHRDRVQQGTCWTAGCHEAVHGSRVNSSLRY
ncbi:MAG TPA: cytochrome c3 family protein [Verrucomicrobiae bacterium]|nr:cytochrome c3 family protein [Verrucomicrobiae bacterium]